MTEVHQLLLSSNSPSPHATVSILESKRELEEELSMGEKSSPDQKAKIQCEFVNRQVTTNTIVDWKEFKVGEDRQAELSLKDGENGDRIIFDMMVKEWREGQPSKVIYRWIRRPQQAPEGLLEEEHLYHGGMLNRHKHGPGEYLITRRYNDGREINQAIKGSWTCDALENGVLVDDSGKVRNIKGNILVKKSKRQIPEVLGNKTIYLQAQRLVQKRSSTVKPSQQDSKESVVSILDKLSARDKMA